MTKPIAAPKPEPGIYWVKIASDDNVQREWTLSDWQLATVEADGTFWLFGDENGHEWDVSYDSHIVIEVGPRVTYESAADRAMFQAHLDTKTRQIDAALMLCQSIVYPDSDAEAAGVANSVTEALTGLPVPRRSYCQWGPRDKAHEDPDGYGWCRHCFRVLA